MKVNWKVRFKNKAWLASFFAAILTFVYTMFGMFDIYPEVTKNDIGEIISSVLMFLSLMGVIVDPTTAGLNDSVRAMGYNEPYPAEYDPRIPKDIYESNEDDSLIEDIEMDAEETVAADDVDQGESES